MKPVRAEDRHPAAPKASIAAPERRVLRCNCSIWTQVAWEIYSAQGGLCFGWLPNIWTHSCPLQQLHLVGQCYLVSTFLFLEGKGNFKDGMVEFLFQWQSKALLSPPRLYRYSSTAEKSRIPFSKCRARLRQDLISVYSRRYGGVFFTQYLRNAFYFTAPLIRNCSTSHTNTINRRLAARG